MNKKEARAVALEILSGFREKPFAALAALMDDSPLVFERKGARGADYQIEVEIFWDDPRVPGGNLRVMAAVDDGRLLAFLAPLAVDFILSPDGSFVGE